MCIPFVRLILTQASMHSIHKCKLAYLAWSFGDHNWIRVSHHINVAFIPWAGLFRGVVDSLNIAIYSVVLGNEWDFRQHKYIYSLGFIVYNVSWQCEWIYNPRLHIIIYICYWPNKTVINLLIQFLSFSPLQFCYIDLSRWIGCRVVQLDIKYCGWFTGRRRWCPQVRLYTHPLFIQA
jgi:hypothetical protein